MGISLYRFIPLIPPGVLSCIGLFTRLEDMGPRTLYKRGPQTPFCAGDFIGSFSIARARAHGRSAGNIAFFDTFESEFKTFSPKFLYKTPFFCYILGPRREISPFLTLLGVRASPVPGPGPQIRPRSGYYQVVNY